MQCVICHRDFNCGVINNGNGKVYYACRTYNFQSPWFDKVDDALSAANFAGNLFQRGHLKGSAEGEEKARLSSTQKLIRKLCVSIVQTKYTESDEVIFTRASRLAHEITKREKK